MIDTNEMNDNDAECFYDCPGCGKTWLTDDCILSTDGLHCAACGEKVNPFMSEREDIYNACFK